MKSKGYGMVWMMIKWCNQGKNRLVYSGSQSTHGATALQLQLTATCVHKKYVFLSTCNIDSLKNVCALYWTHTRQVHVMDFCMVFTSNFWNWPMLLQCKTILCQIFGKFKKREYLITSLKCHIKILLVFKTIYFLHNNFS